MISEANDRITVYQYTFRMPDDDRSKDPHTVMWDYNVGLVRFTSFFKSLKHSKVFSVPLPFLLATANEMYLDNASKSHER